MLFHAMTPLAVSSARRHCASPGFPLAVWRIRGREPRIGRHIDRLAGCIALSRWLDDDAFTISSSRVDAFSTRRGAELAYSIAAVAYFPRAQRDRSACLLR